MKTKKQISTEEMVLFINENSNLIPKRSIEKFKSFDIEKQYHKMLWYVKTNEMKNEMKNQNVMVIRVKKIFTAKNASVEDAKAVIDYCNSYIEDITKKTLTDIEKEIERLMNLKNELSKKR